MLKLFNFINQLWVLYVTIAVINYFLKLNAFYYKLLIVLQL